MNDLKIFDDNSFERNGNFQKNREYRIKVEFVEIRESFLLSHWSSLKNVNLGLKIRNWKFFEI